MSKIISWDEYFMNITLLASLRSKDVNTKVGAIIVDQNNRVIGMGYNGIPSGLDETLFPTTNDLVNNLFEDTKYPYMTHAEMNAILNTAVFDLSNSKLYCTLFPCCECAKAIIQKKIVEVNYISDKHHNDPVYIASRRLFEASNIVIKKYEGNIFVNPLE